MVHVFGTTDSASTIKFKDGLKEEAKRMFSGITVSSISHRYLGSYSYIGTKEGKDKFIQEKIVEWEEDITARL